MYTSENNGYARRGAARTAVIYLFVSIFCFVFFVVYDRFSHSVRSNYMTFLFAFPLLLGFVPYMAAALFSKQQEGGTAHGSGISSNLYNSGVASVTVSSLLRGIFDIAGTYSDYQSYLMAAGIVFLAAGVIVCICQKGK